MIEREDGLIDATEMCKSKNASISEYLRRKTTIDYLAIVTNRLGKTKDELISYNKTRGAHVWVHPVIALHLAQWISVESAADANIWIAEKLIQIKDQAEENPSNTCHVEQLALASAEMREELERAKAAAERAKKDAAKAERKLKSLETGNRNLDEFVEMCLDSDCDRIGTGFARYKEIYNVYKWYCRKKRKDPIHQVDLEKLLIQRYGAEYDDKDLINGVMIKHDYKGIGYGMDKEPRKVDYL